MICRGLATLFLFVLFSARAVCGDLPIDLRSRLVANGHALIIAVWDYDDLAWRQPHYIQDLIRRQADRLQVGLAPHFQTVTQVINPTIDGLRSTLRQFFAQEGSNEGERLFVFYVGHGFTDPYNNNGFITARDTPAFRPGDAQAADRSLSMQEYDALSRLAHSRQVLTIFDSCFSGTILWAGLGNPRVASPLDEDHIRGLLRQPVRYYITAGDYQEEVPADLDVAAIVLDGINGAAAGEDGEFVTGEQLGIYLEEQIPRRAQRNINPQAGAVRDERYARGQFVFYIQPNTRLTRYPQSPAISIPSVPAMTNQGADGSQVTPGSEDDLVANVGDRVYFDFNKEALTPYAIATLDRQAAWLRKFNSVNVLISGNCDEHEGGGKEIQAIALGLRRVNAVAAYLKQKGIAGSRIMTTTFGATQPSAVGHDVPSWAQNRNATVSVR